MGDCNSTPVEGSIRVTVIFKEFSNYVEFGGQATVFDLKIEVTNEFEIPSEHLQVTYNGQTLSDDGIIEKIVTDLAIPITILDTRSPEQITAQPGKTPQLVSTDVPKIVPRPPEPAPLPVQEPTQSLPSPGPAVVDPPTPVQPLQSPRPPPTPKAPINIPPSTPKGPINIPPSTPKGPSITSSTPRQTSPPLRPLQTPRAVAPTAALSPPQTGQPKIKSAPPPSAALNSTQNKINVSSGEGKKPVAKKKAPANKDGAKLSTLHDVAVKIMEKTPANPNGEGANKPAAKKVVKKAADPNAAAAPAPAGGAKGKAKKVGNEDGIEAKGKTKKVVKKVAVTTTTTTTAN